MVCFRKCVCESGTHTCVYTLLYMCMNFKVSRVFEVKESGFEFGAKLPSDIKCGHLYKLLKPAPRTEYW